MKIFFSHFECTDPYVKSEYKFDGQVLKIAVTNAFVKISICAVAKISRASARCVGAGPAMSWEFNLKIGCAWVNGILKQLNIC